MAVQLWLDHCIKGCSRYFFPLNAQQSSVSNGQQRVSKMVLGTFAISIATYLIVKLLSSFMLIYGKRRLVLSLLIGFFIGYFVKENIQDGSLLVIGNIIPGLIASWMDRQGVFRTISVILITASIVQLMLMLSYRGVFHV